MNFSDLYPNAKPRDIINKHTLMASDHEEPCVECGTPTRFIDYVGECRFCSEKCQDRFWQRATVSCGDFPDEINLKAAAVAVENYIDNPSMETLREIARKLCDSYCMNVENASDRGKPSRDSSLFLSRAVARTSSMNPMKKEDFGGDAHKMINEIVKDADAKDPKYYNVGSKLVELYSQLLVTAHMTFCNGAKSMLSIMQYMRGE